VNPTVPRTAADLQAMWRRAEMHAGQREWAEAIACFEAILAASPQDARTLVQLSYVHSLAGHYRLARDHALRAAAARPREPAVVAELVARLRTFNEVEALHACVERLRPYDCVPIQLLLACAAQYSNLNEQERALELLDEARRGDPEFPTTLLARGQVLMYLGRFDEAEAEVLRAIRRAPEIAQAWWLLARLRRWTPESNHLTQISAQLQRSNRKPMEVAMLADALHKEFDDIGDHAKAWTALERACAAKRSTLDYRMEDSRALVSALVDFAADIQPARDANGRAVTRTPIFIVGMHRSGTTLLEQLLDGHSEVNGVGELYDFTSQMRLATDHHCRGVIDRTIVERARGIDFAAAGAGYLGGMEWRLGKEPFFTDKLPSNFLNIGFIARALPQAKILHMVRDPIETCFSNLRELFSDANPFSYDQLELADYYKQYRRLMAHWHQVLPGRVLDVSYAALTRDPEGTLREVCDFCGLDFQPRMLDMTKRTRGVATASAVQVRSKVEAREQPKWAPYAQQLQPLIDALAEYR
jgi:tetratricopeptide (TPR) repeat protein